MLGSDPLQDSIPGRISSSRGREKGEAEWAPEFLFLGLLDCDIILLSVES